MSCTNSNCNQGCNCSNCCPPITPPTPPVPPTCVGTNCAEIYDGACIDYTGPAIPCFGITSGFSLNTVVQLFANKICECCTKPKCKNPLEFYFDFITEQQNNLPNISPATILSYQSGNGLILPTCELCCPDNSIWAIGNNTVKSSILNLINQPYHIGVNNNIGFNDCKKKFDNIPLYAELIVSGINEIGSILGNTQLCTVFDFVQQYNTVFPVKAFDVLDNILTNGLVVSCIGTNGEIFIGDATAFANYYNSIVKKICQ